MAEYVEKPGSGVAFEEREEVEIPRRFRVLLHNDNYTTMEFVVDILEEVFRKRHEEAMAIMMRVHKNGTGVAGVYIKAIAEMKVAEVHALAQEYEFPLRCSMEPE